MNEQKQLYGVAIFEEEIVLSDYTGNGEKRFTISPEQLSDFFRTDIRFRPFPGLIWMKSGSTSDTFLITLPARERTILYRVKDKGALKDIKLHLPAIACRVDVADGRISSVNLWGYRGKLQAETILYELPLPNLSGSSLCLGGTERVVAGDIVGAVERTVFDTPFNHHNHIVGKDKISFLIYVKRFGGRSPFATLNKIGKGREILES